MLFAWPPPVMATVAVIDFFKALPPVGFVTEPYDVIAQEPFDPFCVYRPCTYAVPLGPEIAMSVQGNALFAPLAEQPRSVGDATFAAWLMIETAAASPASADCCADNREFDVLALRPFSLVKLIIDATKMMRTTVMPSAITSAIPSSPRRRRITWRWSSCPPRLLYSVAAALRLACS